MNLRAKNLSRPPVRSKRVLREDPAGIYGRMDLASRDYCRRVVDQLARQPLDGTEVARAAVALAGRRSEVRSQRSDLRTRPPTSDLRHPVPRDYNVCSHVGYYLVDEGRTVLEADVGYRRHLARCPGRHAGRAPLALLPGRRTRSVVAHRGCRGSLGWRRTRADRRFLVRT